MDTKPFDNYITFFVCFVFLPVLRTSEKFSAGKQTTKIHPYVSKLDAPIENYYINTNPIHKIQNTILPLSSYNYRYWELQLILYKLIIVKAKLSQIYIYIYITFIYWKAGMFVVVTKLVAKNCLRFFLNFGIKSGKKI